MNNARLIYMRSCREYLLRYFPIRIRQQPMRLVYMTGMPRTGTSLLKNYFGDHPKISVQPFQPKGFYISARKSRSADKMIIDKSTHYIFSLNNLHRGIRGRFGIVCIIRDPRDELMSLFEIDRHSEIPLNEKFWPLWVKRYEGFLNFAKKSAQPCFMLRYEDLVRYPEKAKIAFLKWLGFDTNYAKTSGFYNVAHYKDGQDPKVSLTNSIIDKQVGKYKKVRLPERIKVINAFRETPRAYYFMEKMGYFNKEIDISEWEAIHNLTFFIPNK